jgi:hypothetical protein
VGIPEAVSPEWVFRRRIVEVSIEICRNRPRELVPECRRQPVGAQFINIRDVLAPAAEWVTVRLPDKRLRRQSHARFRSISGLGRANRRGRATLIAL